MRELSAEEVEQVSGGGELGGYSGAGLVMTTLALGASTGPLAPTVWGIGLGAAGGLFVAQLWANYTMR